MATYNPQTIEPKWQRYWEEHETFRTRDGGPAELRRGAGDQPKCYVLDMFPYPSGDGLHVGHPKGYIATDVFARYKMMRGYNVLHPMGWDAFGLPAENYALQHSVHPRAAVERNIARFKDQLRKIGFTYDWSREINTTDPAYYTWTQWIFLKLYERGLAYESHEPINWCPSCQTGLANEDLEDGRCERCGSLVERRPMRQWVLKITAYADRLLQGLDALEWPESIKESQRNWIGRREGAQIRFALPAHHEELTVFTTRPDTLFGVTYLVIAPEHTLVRSLLERGGVKNRAAVEAYVAQASQKTERERQAAAEREKTGVQLEGVVALHPVTKEKLPVWVADYVLAHYGTGAVMAVPAHDERDLAFARAFRLPIKHVVVEGVLQDSGEFTGLAAAEARERITAWLEQNGRGASSVSYKLRDWVFSRQRYWGEPIPIVHCKKCGVVPVPESDLPVTLPEVEQYAPTGTGESPLFSITAWVNTTCPRCGGNAKRETNTMPQWAGSSWYYLRYIDPRNGKRVVDPAKEKYWMPVDVYVGGAEHATRHLIYARFWHQFLYDEGIVSTAEPFRHLQHVGLILAEDGKKMSKRWGNVINPDDIVATYGADTLRVYEMFMGPFNEAVAWSARSIIGPRRFLERLWHLAHDERGSGPMTPGATWKLHETIQRVTAGIEGFRFNTAVAALMELLNTLEREAHVNADTLDVVVRLLNPFAPHVAAELWEKLGHSEVLARAPWPQVDSAVLQRARVSMPIQVNGKVRGVIELPRGATQAAAQAAAQGLENVTRYLKGGQLQKVIFVPDTLINFVVKSD